MNLSQYTISLLEDIERRIDPETEDDYFSQWMEFWYGNHPEVVFTPRRKKVSVPSVQINHVNINDAIEDYELMLCHQLEGVSRALSTEAEALSVRSNYGTGIMTSLFGAEIFVMPRETDTLPTTKSFNDTDKIREIVAKGIPDIYGGFGEKVFRFGEFWLEIVKNYPKIAKYVFMYHPDCQGPLDVAELMWGGEMFYEMYDDEDFVHEVMALVTATYKKFMDKWFEMYHPRADLNSHWGILMKGAVLIRDDSAMNLSPDFYKEFAYKYDAELLDYYGGGVMHYCGTGDHFVPILTKCKSLTGINLSQPHLNNMDKIFSATAEDNKKILILSGAELKAYSEKPDAVRGMIHGRI